MRVTSSPGVPEGAREGGGWDSAWVGGWEGALRSQPVQGSKHAWSHRCKGGEPPSSQPVRCRWLGLSCPPCAAPHILVDSLLGTAARMHGVDGGLTPISKDSTLRAPARTFQRNAADVTAILQSLEHLSNVLLGLVPASAAKVSRH